jgi:DNA polymerase-3 subunit epsilon
MYAIVDIETTGINHRYEKVTEIAIFVHDGTKVVEEFSTLINPERNIPAFITRLTGINDEMVANAPKFCEVAKRIVELTENRIFVAHNANFDYRFIREEFLQLGYEFKRETLCTVRTSRRFIPGKRSYSLGNLCQDLGIRVIDRHRAAGDALATVKLLELLLSKNGGKLNGSSQLLTVLPENVHPALDVSIINKLPHEPGIYYFLNEQGNIIYIGKGSDIHNCVISHFNKTTTKKALALKGQIADIGCDITGSELVAQLLQYYELTEHQPCFNRRPKAVTEDFNFGNDSFWIIDRGRHAEERSVIRVTNGQYSGFGFISIEIQVTDFETINDCVKSYPDSNEARYMIRNFIHTHPWIKVIRG